MSSIVSIDVPQSHVTLGPDGSAEVRCVVTHRAGPACKIGYRTVPEGRLPARALSIRGARARELPAGGSTELVVDVKAGAGLAPGDYRFSVLVFDVADPGERFDESSAVTLSSPAPDVTVPPLRRPWKTVLFVAALAGVVGILLLQDMLLERFREFRILYQFLHLGPYYWYPFLRLGSLLAAGLLAPPLMAAAATRLGQAWSVVLLGALGVPVLGFILNALYEHGGPHDPLLMWTMALLFAAYLVFDERSKSRSVSPGSTHERT